MTLFSSKNDESLTDLESKMGPGKVSASVDTKALISQLKLIASDPSVLKGLEDGERLQLKQVARSAADALETPFETMVRIVYSIKLTQYLKPLLLVTARIGQDHGIFSKLCATAGPVSLGELLTASKLPCDTLESIMDSICARGMARRLEAQVFTATPVTHLLSSPELRAAHTHYHDSVLPALTKLKDFLHDPHGPRTAWQMGHDTDLSYYAWLDAHPARKEAFHIYMEAHVIGLPTWLDVLDFEKEFAAGARADDVIFVDVGGSNGQQCAALKERYAGLPGRVILQDRPAVLNSALEVQGMEKMGYDYLTEQPVKDSRVLYFRQILHNNDDETCKKILRAQLSAMGSNTVLVIDDKVLPDRELLTDTVESEYQASLSLVMRALFNSQERREAHWRRLVEEAGLVVKEVRKYTDWDDAVVLCVKQ
ncbi:unnamed protein product [Clonostachys byssicola]|uniref:O-methyltransferase C-terminal domain-containing protein n=1 Tax=Clonostachys byssicola TaxID=160290 RepID=A0A9N9Y6C8_9HYPO|nr:unnamed protein product [Clonostachys byssicola]